MLDPIAGMCVFVSYVYLTMSFSQAPLRWLIASLLVLRRTVTKKTAGTSRIVVMLRLFLLHLALNMRMMSVTPIVPVRDFVVRTCNMLIALFKLFASGPLHPRKGRTNRSKGRTEK